jgi:DNA processing protein
LNYSTQHQQIALTLLSGIGSKRARIIVSYFNDLEEFFTDKKLNISKLPGVTETMISWKQRKAVLDKADEIIEQTGKLGGEILFFTDSNYPKKLRQCEDAPLVLYSKGKFNWHNQRSVAIVGTRKMTQYGRELTEELIDGLKNMDVVVVSGMAYGVDVCAHKQALRNNLETWGVLGHGLDKLYPAAHSKVAWEMFEHGGLISEFIPGMDIEPGNFPMRNRIVAGLTDATVVVESGVSGGSIITANLARDYHREVFAFPGDVKKESSAGCLKLIRDNTASLIQSSVDFLESMDWKPAKETIAQTRLFLNLAPEEERVVHCLQEKKELSIDILGLLAKLPVHELSSLLLELEFKGLIRSLPGKRYSLV